MTKLRFLTVLAVSALAAAPAFAGGATGGGAGPGLLNSLLFPVALLVIFYFLLIRPQQRRQKQHREMVDNIKKGDTVVSSGGLIGKVSKISDAEITLEIADNVRVRIVRGMVADVRGKGQPVAANDSKPS